MRALAARVANVTGIPESPLDEWRLSLHYPPGAKAESYHIEGLHLDQNNNPERVASVLIHLGGASRPCKRPQFEDWQ